MEHGNQNDNGNVYTISNTTLPNKEVEHFDNLVTIKSRSAVLKKRNFYKKLSIILIVILVIILIAFIVALYKYVRKYNELKKYKKNAICSSEECLRSAANLKLSMDLSVDPCEDFYKFTCGHWTKEHLNHGWYPHYSSFETADERIAISAINFFQSPSSPNEPLPARQSRDLYLSCMDTKSLDSLGVTVLVKYLKKVNLPVIPTYFSENADANFKFDWIKTEVELKKTFATDTFIGLLVDADIYNRSNNVIYMGTPDSASPLPSPLKSQKKVRKTTKSLLTEDEFEEAKASAYKNMVKGVIKIISQNQTSGVPSDVLLEDAATLIWNISRDVASLSDVNRSSSSLEFFKASVDDLQNVTDQYIIQNNETAMLIWRPYLTMLFEGVPNVTLDLDKRDFLYVPEDELPYLPEISLYLAKLTDVQIELYMWWVTVYSMMVSTTSEINDIISRESEPFIKVNVYRPRPLDCATLAINFMGLAVSYGIADRSFLNNTKPKVEQMLDNIKEAFVERVTNLNWMDAETKRLTLEKSREMISFIGFPDWLLNKEALEIYYGDIVIHNNTFLDNMMEMIQQVIPTQLATLRIKSGVSWRSDPTTVNAYNYFSDNSITVPMAILTHPFYNLGLEVLNYGAIGSILGHELTHGFDNMGRLFDKHGNYKEWWTNNTRMTFENKTNCFVNQYNNYSLPNIDENIDGSQTLSENLADNGGLNHAFLAYQHYLKKHGSELNLPGFEKYSNLQMFFVAYGSVWCETTNVAALAYQIETDEHSPSSIRVLGTLQNLKEFSDAFQCPEGSKMNPKRSRCRIW